jgi:cytochrome c2
VRRRYSTVLITALLASVALSACQSSAAEPATSAAELGPEEAAGRQLFISKGCIACHQVPGVREATGTVGPNLRGIGNTSAHPKIAAVLDNNRENMKRWLINPQAVKPGTAMPSMGLNDDEATKMALFLETLK